MDTNVPPESTYQLVNALIKSKKEFDLLVVPEWGILPVASMVSEDDGIILCSTYMGWHLPIGTTSILLNNSLFMST